MKTNQIHEKYKQYHANWAEIIKQAKPTASFKKAAKNCHKNWKTWQNLKFCNWLKQLLII